MGIYIVQNLIGNLSEEDGRINSPSAALFLKKPGIVITILDNSRIYKSCIGLYPQTEYYSTISAAGVPTQRPGRFDGEIL